MKDFEPSARTQLKRLPKRGSYERSLVYRILDEGLVCHIGFVADGEPVVIPTAYARVGDNLYIHGSPASRMLGALTEGVRICLTVTLLDGLVLARSAFHHSMNYRSVVVFGNAFAVEAPEQKREALRAFMDHVIPGRWAEVRHPNEGELRKTLVLSLPLSEASAKVRLGPPIDDEPDYQLPVWAGEIPLRLTATAPISDRRLAPNREAPAYAVCYSRNHFGGGKRLASDACAQPSAHGDTTSISVGRANVADADAVAAVLSEAFAEYEPLYTAEGYAATTLPGDRIRARWDEGPVWIASRRDKVIGTVSAVLHGEELYVRSMAVVPSARGQRVGELLLRQAEEFAILQNCTRLTLTTTPFLSRAIRLYEGAGFVRSGRGPLDLGGTPLFEMVKNLTAQA